MRLGAPHDDVRLREERGRDQPECITGPINLGGGDPWNHSRVRIKRLTTESERAARQLLGRSLAGTGWAFLMKARIQDVLEKQEDLGQSEFDLYASGHFDFVVFSTSDDLPTFVIEFDGPSHGRLRQVERDIIKNRLCATAELPLLRLGVGTLIEVEQVTVLEWLVQRFVRWQWLLSETDGSDLQKAFFNYLENPFPPNLLIAHRLFDRYGIGCRLRDFEAARALDALRPFWLVREFESSWTAARYCLEVDWAGELPTFEDGAASEFIVATVSCDVRAADTAGPSLHTANGHARFAWANKTRKPGPVAAHPLIPNADAMRTLGLVSTELPWLAGVAEELAIYRALRAAEVWASTNLRS